MDSTAFSDLRRTLDDELSGLDSEILALDLQRQQLVERRKEVGAFLILKLKSDFRFDCRLNSWRMNARQAGIDLIMRMGLLIGIMK